MGKKRAPAAIHSKTPDSKGRTKDLRHGTKHWTTWLGASRKPGLPVKPAR